MLKYKNPRKLWDELTEKEKNYLINKDIIEESTKCAVCKIKEYRFYWLNDSTNSRWEIKNNKNYDKNYLEGIVCSDECYEYLKLILC